MAKWLVSFSDKGNCDILSVEVECFRITNATKVAAKQLTEEQEALVNKEATSVKVEAV